MKQFEIRAIRACGFNKLRCLFPIISQLLQLGVFMLLLNELNILDAAGVQREGRNLLARVADELKVEPLNEEGVAGRRLQWILRVILEFVFVSQEQLAVFQRDLVSRLHFIAAIISSVFRQLRRRLSQR